MTSLPALVAPAEPVWLGGDMGVRSIVEPVVDVVDLPYVLPPLLGTRRVPASSSGSGCFPGIRGSPSP